MDSSAETPLTGPVSRCDLRFPFAAKLEEEHGTIRSLMRWIEAELQRQIQVGLQHDGPVLGPFRVLRAELLKHFEFEEREGFLRELRRRSENGDVVQRLVGQHRNFAARLETLEEELSSAARTDGVLSERVVLDLRCLFQDIRAHDAEETHLLGLRASAP